MSSRTPQGRAEFKDRQCIRCRAGKQAYTEAKGHHGGRSWKHDTGRLDPLASRNCDVMQLRGALARS